MKLTANNDGIIWMTVALNRRTVFPSGSPARKAATMPATKTTVPGIATKFRLTVASSGVGFGATGGIFNTALWRYGIGIRKASKFKYLLIDGKPVMKIKIEATMNGDHPFNTATVEWRLVEVTNAPLTGITSAGLQNFRNTTVASSEKTADTTSTRPIS